VNHVSMQEAVIGRVARESLIPASLTDQKTPEVPR
jgi:hypothetical protein